MAENAYPFINNVPGPAAWQTLGRALEDTGVKSGGGVSLIGGMNVRLAPTLAVVAGFAYENTTNKDFTSAPNTNPSLAVIDALVLRLDVPTGTLAAVIKRGTAAASPASPSLTKAIGGVYEYLLADWRVPANSGGTLTTLRASPEFGWQTVPMIPDWAANVADVQTSVVGGAVEMRGQMGKATLTVNGNQVGQLSGSATPATTRTIAPAIFQPGGGVIPGYLEIRTNGLLVYYGESTSFVRISFDNVKYWL